jgi:hypothetical protein
VCTDGILYHPALSLSPKLIGADVETGGMWDPLGLSKISEVVGRSVLEP